MPLDEHDENEFSQYPKCPHCGDEDHDYWDGLGDFVDGDEWGANCATCGKDYVVMACIETTFATKVWARQGGR